MQNHPRVGFVLLPTDTVYGMGDISEDQINVCLAQ